MTTQMLSQKLNNLHLKYFIKLLQSIKLDSKKMIKLNQAYFSLVLNKHPNLQEQMRYLQFFQKCYLSACFSTMLAEEKKLRIQKVVNQNKVTLPRNFSKKKTLFINLDKTLIISGMAKTHLFRESFHFKDTDLYFSVRPYAIEFLKKVSQYYQIIIYSSAIPNYVIEFFNYFNSKTNHCIKKCLTREHCIQVEPNVFFQDIRIIKNREPEKVAFLSHDITCFRQAIENGIPISPFNGSSSDRELQFILQYLIQSSTCEDIRQINKQTFNIRKIYFPKGEPTEEDSHEPTKSTQPTK